ncbi:MAG: hypothetical protein ACK55I_44675, partial [bacterium]
HNTDRELCPHREGTTDSTRRSPKGEAGPLGHGEPRDCGFLSIGSQRCLSRVGRIIATPPPRFNVTSIVIVN